MYAAAPPPLLRPLSRLQLILLVYSQFADYKLGLKSIINQLGLNLKFRHGSIVDVANLHAKVDQLII